MEIHLGKFLGRGMDRFCYENLDNPNTCLKVSKLDNSRQSIKEARYFKYLQKKGIAPSFMPKFVGLYTIGNDMIMEQEYFRTTEEETAIGLREYLSVASDAELEELEKELQKLKAEMIRLNVIVTDMRTTNFMVMLKDKKIEKLVIFDGYGCPELIPLAQWIPSLGKRKLEKHWKRFFGRYEAEKVQYRQKGES